MISVFTFRNLLLACILCLALGCDSASTPPLESATPPQETTTAPNTRTGGISFTHRFDLDLSVEGSLKPGSVGTVVVDVKNNLRLAQADVRVTTPELSAMKAARKSGQTPTLEMGTPVQPHASWSASMGRGQSTQRRTSVHFDEPGYYQVIAHVTPSDEEEFGATSEGQLVQNAERKDVWVWIDEAAGTVTQERVSEIYPENARSEPGPLTLNSEPQRLKTSVAREAHAKSVGVTTVYVFYDHQTRGDYEPWALEGARVGYRVFDGRGLEVSSNTVTLGPDGELQIPCYEDEIYGEGSFEGTVSTEDNNRLAVLNETGSAAAATFSGNFETDCGQSLSVRAYDDLAHVYHTMQQIITNSRSFFEASRGKLQVNVTPYVENSFYRPRTDQVFIMDQVDKTHVGSQSGNFVVAHEYGHAFHEKGLGVNAASGECPSPHYSDGAHNIECAYSEGFANYHAAVTVESVYDNFNVYAMDVATRSHYPATRGNGNSEDGAIIEGAVAAFLYDLTDGTTESHDDFSAPGTYVRDLIRTCRVDANSFLDAPPNGIDGLIACIQQQAPNYSLGYFPTRSFSYRTTSYSENAVEPAGWTQSNVKKLWRYNLYDDVVPAALTVSIDGPTRLASGEEGMWTANVTGNDGSTSYTWEQDGSYAGSGETYRYRMPSTSTSTQIKVTVSNAGEEAVDWETVYLDDDGCLPVDPGAESGPCL